MVTSKPKRISVAAGVVHMVGLLKSIECTRLGVRVHILRFFVCGAIRITIKNSQGNTIASGLVVMVVSV